MDRGRTTWLEKLLDPNKIKTRDPLIEALINGATKSGVHKDRRKEKNRRKCREKTNDDGGANEPE